MSEERGAEPPRTESPGDIVHDPEVEAWEYLARLAQPSREPRRFHLYVRERVLRQLHGYPPPKGWAPSENEHGLREHLEWLAGEFGVPLDDLRWLILERIPGSWSPAWKPTPFPTRLRELLFGPHPMSSSISSYIQSMRNHNSTNYRFRYYLHPVIVRHRPDLRQLAAVLTGVLGLFDDLSMEEALGSFGSWYAEELESVRQRVTTARAHVRLELLGAFWSQLWGDADGCVMDLYTRWGPTLLDLDRPGGAVSVPYGFQQQVEMAAAYLLREKLVSGWAAEVGRCLVGDPSKLAALDSRPTPVTSPRSSTRTGKGSRGPSKKKAKTGRSRAQEKQKRKKARPPARKAALKRKAKPKKARSKKTRSRPDTKWLDETPKGLAPATARKLWKAAQKLRTFTRRELQDKSGMGESPAKRFLTYAEQTGKLKANRDRVRSKAEAFKYTVASR